MKAYVKGMKRQATDQEKMFANHISNKGLIYKIFKDRIQNIQYVKYLNLTVKQQ